MMKQKNEHKERVVLKEILVIVLLLSILFTSVYFGPAVTGRAVDDLGYGESGGEYISQDAPDFCDTGDGDTTCYVTTRHQIGGGIAAIKSYSLNNLIIQTKGQLNLTGNTTIAATGDIIIDDGGNITSHGQVCTTANQKCLSPYTINLSSAAMINVTGKIISEAPGINDDSTRGDGGIIQMNAHQILASGQIISQSLDTWASATDLEGGNGGIILLNATYLTISGAIVANGSGGEEDRCSSGAGNNGNGGLINITGSYINITGKLYSLRAKTGGCADGYDMPIYVLNNTGNINISTATIIPCAYTNAFCDSGSLASGCVLSHSECASGELSGNDLTIDSRGTLTVDNFANLSFSSVTMQSGSKIDKIDMYNASLHLNTSSILMQSGSKLIFDNNRPFPNPLKSHSSIYLQTSSAFALEKNANVSLKGDICSRLDVECMRGNDIQIIGRGIVNLSGYIVSEGRTSIITTGSASYRGAGGWINISSHIVDISGNVSASTATTSTTSWLRGGNGGYVLINSTHISISGNVQANGDSGDTDSCDAENGINGNAGILNITGSNLNITGTLSALAGTSGGCDDGYDSPILIRNSSGSINISGASITPCADTSYWCDSSSASSQCNLSHKKCVRGEHSGGNLTLDSNGQIVVLQSASLNFSTVTLTPGMKISKFGFYNTTAWINATNLIMRSGSLLNFDNDRVFMQSERSHSTLYIQVTDTFVHEKNANISLKGDACRKSTVECMRGNDIQITGRNIVNLSGYIVSEGRFTIVATSYPGAGGWINISSHILDISGNVSASTGITVSTTGHRGGNGGYVLINGTYISISGNVQANGDSGDTDTCSGENGRNGDAGTLNITGGDLNITGTFSALAGTQGACGTGYDSPILIRNLSDGITITSAAITPCADTIYWCDSGSLNSQCNLSHKKCVRGEYSGRNLTFDSNGQIAVLQSAGLNFSTLAFTPGVRMVKFGFYNTSTWINATDFIMASGSVIQYDNSRKFGGLFKSHSALYFNVNNTFLMDKNANISLLGDQCSSGSLSKPCMRGNDIDVKANLINISGYIQSLGRAYDFGTDYEGPGGHINLTARTIDISGNVSASSKEYNSATLDIGGDGGIIMLNATNITVAGNIFANGAGGETDTCTAGRGTNGDGGYINITVSSFTHTGNISAINGTTGNCKNGTIGEIWVIFEPTCGTNTTGNGSFKPQEKYAGASCLIADSTAPIVDSLRNYTSDGQAFIFSANSSENSNCTLYGNWSGSWAKNETAWNVSAAAQFNFTPVSVLANNSDYAWTVNCSDTSGNVGWAASNISFRTGDQYAPNVYSLVNFTSDRLHYNFSAVSSETGSCTLYGNWSGSWTKNETTSVTANTAFNFTQIALNGSRSNYVWAVNCSDGSNNAAWGANISFTNLNHAPSASNVQISPPTINNTVNFAAGTWAYSDPDTDTENATIYEWYINGTNAWRDPSLVAYWKLDGDVRSSIGTLHGETTGSTNVTNATGMIRSAYRFDGTDDLISVSDAGALETGGQKTVSLWLKLIDNKNTQAIISKYQVNSEDGWMLQLNKGPPAVLLTNLANDAGGYFMGAYYGITFNVTHHVVMAWDTNGGVITLYLNGQNVNTSQVLSGVFSGNSKPLLIGAQRLSSGIHGSLLNGIADEVMIWNRSLSAEEISDLYNMTLYGQIDDTGANHTINNLSSRYFNPATNLTFGVTPYDGYAYGLQVNSTTIMVSDATPPAVASLINYTYDGMHYNFSVTSSETGTCTLYGNWSGSWAKNETASVTANTLFNFTQISFLGNGSSYAWTVNCSDTSNNVGWAAQNITFTVADNYSPNVYSLANYTLDGARFNFSAISSETGTCTLYGNWSGSWAKNETASVTANAAFNFSQVAVLANTSDYTWTVNCSDAFGNVGWAANNISFRTSDQYAPNVYTLVNYTSDRLHYNFSAVSSETGTCTLYGNWSGSWAKNETTSVTANTLFNFTQITYLGNGSSYAWTVNCSDTSSNVGWSAQNTSFSVADAYAPNIYSQVNYTTNRLNYTMSAVSSEAGTCTLYGNWSGSWAKNETKSVSANTLFNFTGVYFPINKNHLWGINCSDPSANAAWGANYTFTVTSTCGNGVIESGESCDGSELNSQTCLTLGYASGTLSCSGCSFVTSNCLGYTNTTANQGSGGSGGSISEGAEEAAGAIPESVITPVAEVGEIEKIEAPEYILEEVIGSPQATETVTEQVSQVVIDNPYSPVAGISISGAGGTSISEMIDLKDLPEQNSNFTIFQELFSYAPKKNFTEMRINLGYVCAGPRYAVMKCTDWNYEKGICNKETNWTVHKWVSQGLHHLDITVKPEDPGLGVGPNPYTAFCGDGYCDTNENLMNCGFDCGGITQYSFFERVFLWISTKSIRTTGYAVLSGKDVAGAESSCKEDWKCYKWARWNESGIRTRICIDTSQCGTTAARPSIEEVCEWKEVIFESPSSLLAFNDYLKLGLFVFILILAAYIIYLSVGTNDRFRIFKHSSIKSSPKLQHKTKPKLLKYRRR